MTGRDLTQGPVPADPLSFIRDCVIRRRVLWTYHFNMRLGQRAIRRRMVLDSVSTYEIIESYPHKRHLPSFLVYARHGLDILHIVFALDAVDENVRIVTAYRPNLDEREADLKTRRK